MRYRLIASIVFFMGTQLMLAQKDETLNLTLEQAVEFALDHNIQMKNAAQDRRDAQAQKWATIATGLPQISGSVNYQNQLEQPVAQIPAQFFGGEPGTFEEVIFGQPQTFNAGVSWNQLLFDGSYIVGVQATKTFLEYSENLYNKTSLEVRASVVEAYANGLMAEKSAALLSKNVAQVERNLYEAQALFDNGLGEEETVDQLQITYATLKSNEKNAYRMARISHYMLNALLGREINAPIKLLDSLEALVGVEMVSELPASFEFDQNIDYLMVENLTKKTALELKLAKSKALPSLSASLNLGRNAFGQSFDFFESGKEYFNTAILGVNLQVPIFSSLLRSANTQRAKIADIKAQNTKLDTERMLSVQFENLSSAFALSKEQFLTAKDNLDLAQRIADKNELKFKEGVASSFDLRQAQLQLYQTQQEYLSSMVRVINTHTELANFLNESL
ncbi:MAG: TolC family protein [Flavobacteriaceae bacterium]